MLYVLFLPPFNLRSQMFSLVKRNDLIRGNESAAQIGRDRAQAILHSWVPILFKGAVLPIFSVTMNSNKKRICFNEIVEIMV